MEIKKPKYPIVLVAYIPTKQGEQIAAREIIKNEDDEANFRQRFSKSKMQIKLEQPKANDYKGIGKFVILLKNTPIWVYVIIGIAITCAIKLLPDLITYLL